MRHFRFHLSTLLLGVLTLAAGATLWWNWSPWQVAYVVECPDPKASAGFSKDGRYLLVKFIDPVTGKDCVDVRLAATGAQRLVLRSATGKNGEVVENDGYITIFPRSMMPAIPAYHGEKVSLFDLETGAEIKLDGKLNGLIAGPFNWSRNYMLVEFEERIDLVKLPDFFVVSSFVRLGTTEKYIRLHKDKLYLAGSGFVQVLDLATEKHIEWRDASDTRRYYPIPSASKVFATYCAGPPYETRFYDASTGRILAKCPGDSAELSPDGQFAIVSSLPVPARRGVSNGLPAKLVGTADGETISDIWGDARYDFVPDSSHILASARFPVESSSALRLSIPAGCVMLDARTGKPIWSFSISARTRSSGRLFSNGRFVFAFDATTWCILDAATGLKTTDWRLVHTKTTPPNSVVTSAASPHFALIDTSSVTSARVLVYGLRRPIEWHGMFYLYEFWIAAVLAASLLVSIWRDARGFKARAA